MEKEITGQFDKDKVTVFNIVKGSCYGKFPFNFKLFRSDLAFKCRRCFSPKRTAPRLIATLHLCAGRLWQ